MCEVSFDEHASVWKESTYTAKRKPRPCDCCGGTVAIGERYVKVFFIFDGEATSEYSCLPCIATRDLFKKHHEGHYTNPSGMPDMLVECVSEESTYDGDADEDVPNEIGAMWQRELDAMDERRERSMHMFDRELPEFVDLGGEA